MNRNWINLRKRLAQAASTLRKKRVYAGLGLAALTCLPQVQPEQPPAFQVLCDASGLVEYI